MTIVVPTSEEDPALAVVRFTAELSWADAGPEVFLLSTILSMVYSSVSYEFIEL